jgi:hypothetical protein
MTGRVRTPTTASAFDPGGAGDYWREYQRDYD